MIVNGEPTAVGENETLRDLVERMRLGGPVACQVNEEIIHRDRLGEYRLREGDRVELFRMMGGG